MVEKESAAEGRIGALDEAEHWVAGDPQWDIGTVGLLQGVSYLGEKVSDEDPLYPDYSWQEGRPALAAWYAETIQRPSVQSHLGKDYEGDQSAANHQRHVAEVLAAQSQRGTS